MMMKDVLFVQGLNNNLLSISVLEAKGMRVAFVDGQFLMWLRGETIDDAIVIGEQEGVLYKLKGHLEQALVHDTIETSEIWHRRLAHVHYRALPIASKVVEGLQKSKQNMMGSAKDVQKERIQRRHFQAARAKKRNLGNHPLRCMQTNVIKFTKWVCILCLFH